ncbi:MAG: hypothetical protein LLF97_02110 [Planctomycetaceae bacterium]|nr:hypothetical protein [Planctomycetaceae bacterium]
MGAFAVFWALGPALGGERPDTVFDEARQAVLRGDFDAAIARLNPAIAAWPHEARLRGLRGAAWIGKRQYAKGRADLEAAMASHPGDVSQKSPPPRWPLSPSLLRHGRRQVRLMLRDRPSMAEYGESAQFLRTWAVRKFAGEELGSPIDWDPSLPLYSDAEHVAPSDGEHAAIQVGPFYTEGEKQGRARSFEELWAGAVFELHNVTFAPEFVRLNEEADRGTISKRAFVREIVKRELLAAQRTRAFYVRQFLPWAESQKVPSDSTLWFCDWWDTPETAMRGFGDKSVYPWRPYARVYDWNTVFRHWREGHRAWALRLLERMRGEQGFEDDRENVEFWIQRAHRDGQ